MGKFRHHSNFSKPKQQQAFRFPYVCFSCRKSFKYPARNAERICPQCAKPMTMLSRKFSTPKSKDIPQWKKVEHLVRNGFRFYSFYEKTETGGSWVRYPTRLADVNDFVERYKGMANK
jgi:DNA-directed RNA polymerase subunit RPC12/RpoP